MSKYDVTHKTESITTPGGLQLGTRLPARSVTRSAGSFRRDIAYTAHWRLCDYAPYTSTIYTDIDAAVPRVSQVNMKVGGFFALLVMLTASGKCEN